MKIPISVLASNYTLSQVHVSPFEDTLNLKRQIRKIIEVVSLKAKALAIQSPFPLPTV